MNTFFDLFKSSNKLKLNFTYIFITVVFIGISSFFYNFISSTVTINAFVNSNENDIILSVTSSEHEVKVDVQVVFYYIENSTIKSNNQEYNYQIYRNDILIMESTVIFELTDYNLTHGGYVFKDCLPGDVIVIKDVHNYANDNILLENRINLNITPDNYIYESITYPSKNTTVIDCKTNGISIDIDIIDLKLSTNQTYISNGGKYDIAYILENYNAFCFENLQGIHVIGPVIVQENAFRTKDSTNNSKESLVVSDLSKGISSYIGNILTNSNEEYLEVALNYGYDALKNIQGFIAPTFFTKYTGNYFATIFENWENLYYFVDENLKGFLSPSYNGRGEVLQNDKYIDFEIAKQQLLQQSMNLVDKSTIEVYPDTNNGYLAIEAGYSYTINNAHLLRVIDIVFPEGFNILSDPFPYNTTINIDENNLVLSGTSFNSNSIDTSYGNSFTFANSVYPTINNEIHQYLPLMLINGEVFNGSQGLGYGYEFGDNSGILFNMPNLENIPVALQPQSDIVGHIVAPNNDFYNYISDDNGNSVWSGGNINGCVIVNSWNSGLMQMHMWPYHADNEHLLPNDIQIELEASKKLINGNINDYLFDFKIDLISPITIDNEFFPKFIQSSNGLIKSDTININKEGRYIFEISEINNKHNDIIYDTNIFTIVIDVIEENNELSYTKTTYLKDDVVDEIIFINEVIQLKYDLQFIKVDYDNRNILLPNAMFVLYQLDENMVIIEHTLIKCTSDENGLILFNDLNYGSYYLLSEIKPPDGYSVNEVDWLIYANSDNKEVIITTLDGEIVEIDDNEITNKKIDILIPSTGGTGNKMYNTIGLSVISISCIYYYLNKNIIKWGNKNEKNYN